MSVGRLFLLAGVTYCLLLIGLASLSGALVSLTLPLIIYLGAALIYAPDAPHLRVSRTLSADRILPGASVERRALLKHASRTLIKQGHADTLAAWGLGRRMEGEASLAVSPRRVCVGESLRLDVTLRSASPRPQKLAIDYAVHHVKASGETTPKVFKGWVLELGPHEERSLSKGHSMRLITTRRYHAGPHGVDLRVNGGVVATASFDLRR